MKLSGNDVKVTLKTTIKDHIKTTLLTIEQNGFNSIKNMVIRYVKGKMREWEINSFCNFMVGAYEA